MTNEEKLQDRLNKAIEVFRQKEAEIAELKGFIESKDKALKILQNTYNETALILSCKLKDINTINYLLNTNCDKNITDCYGNTFNNYTQLYGLNVKTNNNYTYNNKSLDYLINYIITQY